MQGLNEFMRFPKRAEVLLGGPCPPTVLPTRPRTPKGAAWEPSPGPGCGPSPGGPARAPRDRPGVCPPSRQSGNDPMCLLWALPSFESEPDI